MTVEMVPTAINGRWNLSLPRHRAARPEWPWWEATRLAAMHHVLGEGGHVVWDVGAEEGDFPALWASWGNQVVLAEANPAVWPNIRAIFEANDLVPPLVCWPGFFGETVDIESVPFPGWDVVGWPLCAAGEVIGDHGFCQLGERPDLPTTTIDRLVDDGAAPPTVLTMDVEGSELHVLRGARHVLAAHRPHVFVSIHETFMLEHYGLEHGVEMVRNLMAGHGYEETYLCTDHEAHWWFRPA